MNIHFNNYAKKIGTKYLTSRDLPLDWYKWRVFVEERDEVLDEIEYVEYLLHPSFPRPNRRKNDKLSKFALDSEGYGSFTMDITVKFKDGNEEYYRYFLDLNKKWPE